MRAIGRRPQVAVIGAGCVLIILFWAALLGHLALRNASQLDQTRRDVTNVSVALAAQVSHLIEGTDQVMRLIQADHDTAPERFDFGAWMRCATFLDDVAVQVATFDAHGDLVAARVPGATNAPRVNNADRPYFRYLAEHPEAGLYVGRTIQGRILGVPSFQLVRRLNGRDGSFAGILIVSLNPDFLARQFKALDIGEHGSISLFGRDGYIRARWPVAEGMYDRDTTKPLGGSGLFGQLEHAPVGTYQIASIFDGEERIFGYRAVEGRPLVVTVGKSVDEALKPLVAESHQTLAVGIAVTAILITGLSALVMELDRRRRREAQLVVAHEAAARSEARFRLIADHATDMIVQLDAQGRRVFVSPSSLTLFGHPPEALLGTRPRDSVHPDDLARFDATMLALASGEQRSTVSVQRHRRADGSWVWVEASWQAVRTEDGALGGYVGSVRDITARQGAEAALRESEARYRTLTDTLPQLVWVSELPSGDAVYVNRQFESYCGPIGRSREGRRALIHPADLGMPSSAWDEAMASGEAGEIEWRLRRHDGAYRWHKIVMVPIRHDGELVGWLGTALDIDEIIEARKALQETSDLLRLAQEGAGAGSWDFDLVTGQVVLSPESARLHGLPAEDPVLMSISEWRTLTLQNDGAETMRHIDHAVDAGTTFETEFRVVLPGGGVRWLQGVGRTYYDATRRPVRMIGLNFDITARKDVEIAQREARDAAEAARTEAERASAAKTDFLASMSHEIRTPLNAMIGFTDLLAGSPRMPPDLRRQAELARSAGGALLTIVNDILDFAQVEAGRIALEHAPFVPASFGENCLSIMRGAADAKAIALRSEIDPNLPRWLVGDEARLRQILLNLLNNAVKFTKTGSVTLSVRHEGFSAQGPRSGERVRFSVTDTGIGIPRDKQHRLFERFSQVDGSIRRDFGGTGLGLAISRQLVEVMGGEIGVVSEQGQGATFWFALTLPRGAAPGGPAVVVEGAAPRRSGRLLLVEDVAINQELARAVLEAVGHSVEVVGDGAAAVEAVRHGTFDLVLMDVQMPGMDGMTATRLIRALDHPARTIPIVAMTANVLSNEIKRFREAGMDDHVGKPFARADLYAVIDRWLPDRARVAADPPAAGEGALDRDALDTLIELQGASGVIRLLDYLDDELRAILVGETADADARAGLRRQAHILVSAAGMIGFLAVSEACGRLEACTEEVLAAEGLPAFDVALAHARALALAALAESDRTARALAASADGLAAAG